MITILLLALVIYLFRYLIIFIMTVFLPLRKDLNVLLLIINIISFIAISMRIELLIL